MLGSARRSNEYCRATTRQAIALTDLILLAVFPLKAVLPMAAGSVEMDDLDKTCYSEFADFRIIRGFGEQVGARFVDCNILMELLVCCLFTSSDSLRLNFRLTFGVLGSKS